MPLLAPVSQNAVTRRAKPLLGTLVEIGLLTTNVSDLEQIQVGIASRQADLAVYFDVGFAALAQVQQTMSIHDSSSDLSVFNANVSVNWLKCAPQIIAVLGFAQALSARSEGVFDVFCKPSPLGAAITVGNWQDLVVDTAKGRVRKLAPLHADLGGIAKGYAVDTAVDAIEQLAMRQQIASPALVGGWVNAGGDVRVFGDCRIPMYVRDPKNIARAAWCKQLYGSAAATSAQYYPAQTGKATHKYSVDSFPNGHLLDGQTGRVLNAEDTTGASWTVFAPTCMAADALTKLAAAVGDTNSPMLQKILAHYGASLWVL